MIKVLVEKKVPRDTVKCNNCGSLLEYGNADLRRSYNDYNNVFTALGNNYAKSYELTCPVCGCSIDAHWIRKEENV